MNGEKKEKIRIKKVSGARSKVHRFSMTYTGSPDSEAVAERVREFCYDPARTNEIAKKYEAIKGHR